MTSSAGRISFARELLIAFPEKLSAYSSSTCEETATVWDALFRGRVRKPENAKALDESSPQKELRPMISSCGIPFYK